jgi:serine/threonine protein kinase
LIELLELSRGGKTFISDIAYMSKERLQTNTKYGFESDIWSLGITLIVIITGQVPYPTKEGQYQLIKVSDASIYTYACIYTCVFKFICKHIYV